jgi:hypothetical protein
LIGSQRLLLSLIISLVTCGGASATSYYVTQSGGGSQNGSGASNSWSVASFNGSSAPTGGDTVFFSGTITSTVTPKTSGTGNGASRLTLDFTAASLNTANPRIQLNAKNYLNILGGTFGTSSSGTLILTNGAVYHDVTFSGWTYVGAAGGTAAFLYGPYPQFIEISNNHLDNVSGLGYSDTAQTHDILISGNYIRTSVNTSVQTDVVTFGDAYNVTIEKNMLINRSPGDNASGQHNDVIQTFHSGSGGAADPSGWTIRYNWIELAMANSRTGDNSWMQMEQLNDNKSGFACKIYANVFVGSGPGYSGNNGSGCSMSGNSHTYYYNNTVVRKNGPDKDIGSGTGGTFLLKNNVLMADNSQSGTFFTFPGVTVTADYNFWSQNAGSTYTGSHGATYSNPLFVDYANNNFALQGSSPFINAGDSTIGAEYNQGIQPGATWPNPTLVTRTAGAWDAGAYQYNGSSRPNPPGSLTTLVQ